MGGALPVLGIQTRWVARVLSPFLAGAPLTARLANGCAYLFVLCIAQAMVGDGALALSPSRPLRALLGGPLPQLARR